MGEKFCWLENRVKPHNHDVMLDEAPQVNGSAIGMPEKT
ncbi:hypothetical protein X471_00730 [Bartonella bacilliformis str. Heidi Mejia]|uniref:Uncharacterized protein n=2 Tax=Bartonella bacilliformis TaxID=774 RepID=A1URI3_BARBK|nr:hypothetical protein BARBAKC583_0254 [Bartonella bacilliformis KC583]EKS45887.1 hypothetical protein BbINS_01201 [Bartonella bacilliformis INS]EYS89387.1 hypothetical protein X472_00729 [Bartonella bacilliformis San Pedro600-02]EYS91655.1 hypothetical protein X471_00730 [Bartonella bacilliformis str. Heidi Mejia]EYS94105.1 hypothetical protein X470_01166 [Bartonella bacilliformis Peru-18]KEG17175.1 hypothetical protein H705_00225 [Bartonella bacilliformis Cond044]KEG18184.1 hypothetical pr